MIEIWLGHDRGALIFKGCPQGYPSVGTTQVFPESKRTFGASEKGRKRKENTQRRWRVTESRRPRKGSGRIEHFCFCYRLPCPIHSAFSSGMGGRPTNFRSTQFTKMLECGPRSSWFFHARHPRIPTRIPAPAIHPFCRHFVCGNRRFHGPESALLPIRLTKT